MIEPAIYHYCQYQERCHKEVRNKLYELGFSTATVELQISELIEAGILSEERFAAAFARGKFRMLEWGRVKIKQQLRFRGVSQYCINKAMKEIDGEEYDKTLWKLAKKKLVSMKVSGISIATKGKLNRYLVQKGYESDLIMEVLNKIAEE